MRVKFNNLPRCIRTRNRRRCHIHTHPLHTTRNKLSKKPLSGIFQILFRLKLWSTYNEPKPIDEDSPKKEAKECIKIFRDFL